MQFGKFEEVLEIGYQAALKILEKFEEEGKLPSAFINGKDGNHTEKKKGKSARRNSI